jgi:hypothetical protein
MNKVLFMTRKLSKAARDELEAGGGTIIDASDLAKVPIRGIDDARKITDELLQRVAATETVGGQICGQLPVVLRYVLNTYPRRVHTGKIAVIQLYEPWEAPNGEHMGWLRTGSIEL